MIGFVYILVNEYMPDVYKVGCTERAPHERAAELSKSTGVPAPFEVLCYIEAHEFQVLERDLHAWLKNFRISDNREFFHEGLQHAVAWMWWHPNRLAYCCPRDTEARGEQMFFSTHWPQDLFGENRPSYHALPSPFNQDAQRPGNPLLEMGAIDL